MHIKTITRQHRRDFYAIYECEHCGHTVEKSGYDDAFFHNKVVPTMKCEKCGQIADTSYEPRVAKYPEGFQI